MKKDKKNLYFGQAGINNAPYLSKLIDMFDSYAKFYVRPDKAFFKFQEHFSYEAYLEKTKLNKESMSPDQVFKYLAPFVQNMPNWLNPGTMINVIPPPNLLSVASSAYICMLNPNMAQDTFAGLVSAAEFEVAKYISELVGWNWKKSYGLFTFGGKATNLYGTKLALQRAYCAGLKNGYGGKEFFIITGELGHPCHKEVCAWLGIGSDACVSIECAKNSQEIDLKKARAVIEQHIAQGKIFLGFNLNGGSTNEFAIDPVKKVYRLSKQIQSKYQLSYRPFIHVDSVLGWVYLFFNEYDFNKNELKIDAQTLLKIQSLALKTAEFKYADSLGIDFHKTGFCPYTSSLFLVQNKNDYFNLNASKKSLQEPIPFGSYATFESSLELTRSATGQMAALTCLKSLGIKGFQQIIADLLSAVLFFRKTLRRARNLWVISAKSDGFATFLLIKPPKFQTLCVQDFKNLTPEQIQQIKTYNQKFALFVEQQAHLGTITFTFTASRSYVLPESKITVGALKLYPMSVYFDKDVALNVAAQMQSMIKFFEKNYDKLTLRENQYVPADLVYRQS